MKAVGEVYSPVAGEVTEVNAGLASDQTPLAKDPFGKGWLFKVKVEGGRPTPDTWIVKAYEKHLATEAKQSGARGHGLGRARGMYPILWDQWITIFPSGR